MSGKVVAPVTVMVLMFAVDVRAEDGGENDVRRAVVRVLAVQQAPDWLKPWTKASSRSVCGSGTLIDERRILTNAHLVLYSSHVHVQPYQSSSEIPAKVTALAAEVDLALLELREDASFESRRPLAMASALPRVRDTVSTYGYPIGGIGLSTTKGVVSRIEYSVDGLRVEVSANLNPGDSGGPAVADGQMIGLVYGVGYPNANTGYIIPSEEIQAFLSDTADGKYDGRARIYDELQPLANRSLRSMLGLPEETAGVLVRSVDKVVANNPLRKGDVVFRIGNHDIDNYGMVQIQEDLRLPCSYLIPKTAQDDYVTLSVLRENDTREVKVPVTHRRDWVIPSLNGEYPSYFVFGPLVFSAVSEELVGALSPFLADLWSWQRSPLLRRRGDTAAFDGEQLVIVTAMLPHEIGKGYEGPAGQVVARVNGTAVRNLRHLAETLRDAEDRYLEFEFAEKYVETLVFDRQELRAATEEVLAANGIRQRCSADLQDVWQTTE